MAKKRVDSLVLNSNETITLNSSEKNNALGIIDNGGVAINHGRIAMVASTSLLERKFKGKIIIDAKDEIILPGFVDPHTHLVFGGAREGEFQDRIAGVPYMEALRKGGGIIETVNLTRQASSELLFQLGKQRLDTCMELGSSTVEIKSGYGLRLDDELRILRIIRYLEKRHPCRVVPTFLGAHAIPSGEVSSEYVTNVTNDMLPRVSEEKLATFCDVFCERGAFDAYQSERILRKAATFGLRPKIHADQFTDSGGTMVANKIRATSADHLAHSSLEEIEKMRRTKVVPVVLPASSHSLLSQNKANARAMLDLGLPVALGTDFNPSNWALGQLTVAALASRDLRMTPSEIIQGITINAAMALGLEKEVGSLESGKAADLVTLKIPNHSWVGYTYGENIVDNVLIGGEWVVRDGRRSL
ncbi:MAG TPA: imidazolonepropionase [Candidatus Binatus sp.]|nr:imidazolonepropionase [Candidatus Binatus sp.]